MPTLSAKFQGLFAERMRKRVDAWAGKATISAQIYAPDSLKFWYWQEYGTAGPYPIDPVNAKELVFPGGAGVVVRTGHVNHPGLEPKRMVGSVVDEIRLTAAKGVLQAFARGGADDPDIVHSAVMSAVENAKEVIVESINVLLPGTRDGTAEVSPGRLGGATAASVFAAESTVVDTSK